VDCSYNNYTYILLVDLVYNNNTSVDNIASVDTLVDYTLSDTLVDKLVDNNIVAYMDPFL
jgi:hypothetical protein